MKWYIFTFIAVIGIFLAQTPFSQEDAYYHSPYEKEQFHQLGLNNADDALFFPSSECDGCHGFDPEGIASVDTFGQDINVFDDWRASMLGLSAVDPYWKAKVAHETLLFPNQKEDIEQTCLQCHAPMGHYEAFFNGDSYTMDDFHGDTLGMDGVSCMSCHSIDSRRLGKGFNGELSLDTNKVAFGPYPFPFDGPMRTFVGVTPIYSFHVSDAGMCADCHTLITKSIGLDGNYTGASFVEQATYHEWLNSVYPQEGTTCQSCHMEQLLQPIVVSSGINGLNPRNYYRKHGFSGPNKQMLQAIQQNLDYLGLDIPDSLFDESITRSERLLSERTADMELSYQQVEDSLFIDVMIQNKAGHKFPSGYPARRAYLEILIQSPEGDTLFHSGRRDGNRLTQINLPYEPHHDTITSEDQVQLYQMVNEDNTGQITSSLNASYATVKDNRIPPRGFSTSSSVYDTTLILGNALFDSNFNFDSTGREGSGSDVLTLFLSAQEFINRDINELSISCRLWYEAIPQKELNGIFSAGLPSSDTLANILQDNYFPVLVTSADINNIVLTSSAQEIENNFLPKLYPNPTSQLLYIEGFRSMEVKSIVVYSIDGSGRSLSYDIHSSNKISVELSALKSGYYYMTIQGKQGQEYIFSFVKQ